MVTSLKDEAWLEWMARLLGEPLPQTRPADGIAASSYFCLLDEQPTYLVPQRLLAAEAVEGKSSGPLILNPDCQFSDDGELPPEFAVIPGLAEAFGKGMMVAWVRDPATGMTLPFWLGSRFKMLLAGLRPGEAAPGDLSDEVRAVLTAAKILVEQDYATRRRIEWAGIVEHCAARFREKDYVAVGRLVHPYHLAALRRYYRNQIRNGKMKLGDEHNPRRYVAHNEAVARFFHGQLTSVVASIVGEAVKPSYVYAASYLSGEELKKHTDRPQCEFSISFCLDFTPEPECETPWPLRLDTRAGKLAVYQALGDTLLYRGRELPHYRDPLPEARTSTSLFFHWVAEGFDGELN